MSNILNENNVILFQGDSITDCGRSKLGDGSSLGNGYVNLVNHYITTNCPELNITCINKGVSGNRLKDLKRRWERNTLSLEIDVLSIYIGVNDTWRRYDSGMVTEPSEFRDNYRYLLDSAREKFGNIDIVLMSPFILPIMQPQLEWKEDLNPKIEIIKKLSKEYDTLYVPLQEKFNEQLTIDKPGCYWTRDGVHPTAKGHVLIAKEWIDII